MADLKVLSGDQVQQYRRDGFLGMPRFLGSEWLEPLCAVTHGFIEERRGVDRNDRRFDLEPDHAPEEPRIRRLNSPVDRHELYWKLASEWSRT